MCRLDDDQKQLLLSIITYLAETFKLFIACLLTVFVPQRCTNQPDQICTLRDNFFDLIPYNIYALTFNFITLSTLILFYSIEFKREKWCIQYLDHTVDKSDTNLKLEILDYPAYFDKLIYYNRIYYQCSLISIAVSCFNIISSAILVIYYYYLDYRSILNIITNSLLILEKLFNSYKIASNSNEELCAISAYLITPIVYNTIDDDFKHNTKKKDNIYKVYLPAELLSKLMKETKNVV